jgi:hypothetical protein
MSPRKPPGEPSGNPPDKPRGVGSTAPPRLRDGAGRFAAFTPGPPRRRRGAQPGNLATVKHPWRSFWKRRALREEDRWILPLLGDYQAALVADRGGESGATAAELRLIELAALARGCEMLILAAAAVRGGLTADMSAPRAGQGASVRKQDLLSALSKFMTTEQRALLGLGLERKVKPIGSYASALLMRDAQESPPEPQGNTTPLDVEVVEVQAQEQQDADLEPHEGDSDEDEQEEE